MGIAIQTSKTSRVQALAAARPDLAPIEIARQLGLPTTDVRVALAARGRKRRIKSVAT